MPLVPQNYYNPAPSPGLQGLQGLSPGLAALFDPNNPFVYNVGGGYDQAQMNLESMRLAQAGELGRRQFGSGLLETLMGVQQDPFSIVPALQAYGAAGGGTLGPVSAFAQSGGAGMPSPYGGLVDRLLADLSSFAITRGPEAPAPAGSQSQSQLGLFDIGRRVRQARNTNVANAMGQYR